VDPARRVRLVLLDVDGVLTDNGVWVGGAPGTPADTAGGPPVELKRFDIQDGLGVKLLVAAGIAVELLSGRESPATTRRARELNVHSTQVDGGFKLRAAEERLAAHGLPWADVAVVGDDLADLPLLRRAGLPVAVANAVEEVRALACWATTRPGGSGAVREFAHALLEARGEREAAVARYERARTRGPGDGPAADAPDAPAADAADAPADAPVAEGTTRPARAPGAATSADRETAGSAPRGG
jgi:3-deoxy-D-manno-octulosonate 8-phosphate phosphatase (KDO 8-P phosphatase)